jgi:hypothetical protein
LVTELVEQFPLKWLREVIGDHLLGWAVLDGHFFPGNTIGNKKIPDVDVSGSFSTRRFAIFG